MNEGADGVTTLATFARRFRPYVNDSLRTDVAPGFHYHAGRRQPGLSYMIPVHDLPVGEHRLELSSLTLQRDSLRWSDRRTIYFYK